MSENNNQFPGQPIKELLSSVRRMLQGTKNKNTYEEAERILTYCAEEEDPIAQYQLYALKINGENSENHQEAVAWCDKAAKAGYAPAQYDLGLHYMYGDDMPQDMYQALSWFETSARQGYREAIRKLITLYTAGTRVRRNLPRAEYWDIVLENRAYLEETELSELTPEIIKIRPEDDRARRHENEPLIWATYADLFKPIDQDAVIHADRSKSFVINAGPGTGKTYALIQRINDLVSRQGVDAEEVAVLSFTNAVVNEIKERLIKMAQQAEGDRAIRNTDVRTFHSMAYWMLKNANMQAEEGEEGWENWEKLNLNFDKISYDDCMTKGAELMEAQPDVVQNWQYLIVDEIQDINHGKAKFVLAILKACVKNNVPFMFLGDSCQAIYDYLDRQNTSGEILTSDEFYNEVIDLAAQGKAKFCSFTVNHRSNMVIQSQTEPIRKLILEAEQSSFSAAVLKFRQEAAEKVEFGSLNAFVKAHPDKTICLMARSNINARKISAELIHHGIEHTNVLSIQKDAYPQWIGQILGGHDDSYISRDKFLEWCRAQKIADERSVELWEKFREDDPYSAEIMEFSKMILSLRTHRYDGLLRTEQRKHRIIVSNIHRSKGLEYDYVCLEDEFLQQYEKNIEEMKTLYVAITRAKEKTLPLVNARLMRGVRRDKSKRGRNFYTEKGVRKLKFIEIVENGDKSDVGPRNFVVPDMERAQRVINTLNPNDPVELRLNKGENRYEIWAKNQRIGRMSPYFTSCVRYGIDTELPPVLTDLYIDGVFTYIGAVGEYPKPYEREMKAFSPAYGTHSMWNYVTFSGMAMVPSQMFTSGKHVTITFNNSNRRKKKHH